MATTEERIEITAIDKFSQVLGQAQREFKGLGSSIDTVKNALGAVGVTVGTAAMLQLYADVVKATAALDDMAEQTGATVEGLSKIQTVAKIGGHEFSGVSDAMGKMIKGLKGANEEGQAASHALDFLGVKAKDANGRFRDSADILQDVAKALAKYEDGGNKVALVQDLLGKSGARYLSLLKDMAEEGEQQAKVTAHQAAEAEKLEKNLNRIKIAMEDAKREFVLANTDWLVDFTNKLVDAQKATGGLIAALALLATGGNNTGDIASIQSRLKQIDKEFAIVDPSNKANQLASMITGGISGKFDALSGGRLIQERAYLEAQLRRLEDQRAKDWAVQDNARDGGLAGLEKPYVSPGKPGGGAAAPKTKTLQDLLNEQAGVSKDFLSDWDLLQRGYMSGKLNVEQYTTAVTTLVEKQKFAQEVTKRQADETKRLFEAMEAATKKQEQMDAVVSGLNSALVEATQNMEFETTLIGAGAGVREKAVALRQVDLQVRKALSQLDAEDIVNYPILVDRITKLGEAEKLRLGAVIDEKVAREESQKAAQAAAQQWADNFKRVADDIERALTQGIVDSLMNGFKKGESITDNFIRTLKSAFASAVLTPVISAAVRPIAQGMTGMMASSLPGLFTNGGGIGGGSGYGLGGVGDAFSLANSFSGNGGILGGFGGGAVAGGGFGAGLGSISAGALADISLGGLGGTAGASALGATGGGFMAGLGTAMPYVGAALLAAQVLGLFGEGGGPKPSQLLLRYNPGGTRGQDQFDIGDANLPGGPQMDAIRAVERMLNDPDQYDQEKLAGIVGTNNVFEVPGRWIDGEAGEGQNSVMGKLLQLIGPASLDPGARSALRTSLQQAQDPVGFWRDQMAALQGDLGTSANTLAQWRTEFLAALEDPLSQSTMGKWQALGDAINNASNAAGAAVSNMSTAGFSNLVDYRRAVRLAGGIPQFASGGWHSGGLAIVGEQGPELMDLPAGRIYSNADSVRMSDTSGLQAELAMLRHEVRAMALYAARTAKVLDRFESNGTPVRALDPSARIAVTTS